MGVSGPDLQAKRRLSPCLGSFVCRKFFEAAGRANGINMALGKDGAEPGFQGAATVEVTEERAIGAFAFRQSIQIGEQGISELTGFRGIGVAPENRSGGSAHVGAIGSEEMLPGGLAS